MSAQASTVQDLLAGIIKAVQFLERIHRLQTYIPDRIHELLLGRLEGLVQRMRLDAMARGRPATERKRGESARGCHSAAAAATTRRAAQVSSHAANS